MISCPALDNPIKPDSTSPVAMPTLEQKLTFVPCLELETFSSRLVVGPDKLWPKSIIEPPLM